MLSYPSIGYMDLMDDFTFKDFLIIWDDFKTKDEYNLMSMMSKDCHNDPKHDAIIIIV